jgi:nucleoside 2-deoxyribosyltransferase
MTIRRDLNPRLFAWIREQEEYGRTMPEISSDMIEKGIKNLPNYSPLDKQLILLRAIERRTKYPGFEVKLNGWTDYPLAWANNEDELHYLLNSLEERNLVKLSKVLSGPIGVTLSTDGWEYLEERATKVAFLDRVFVAMSFKKEMDEVWEDGIKPAIEKAGYKALRVDKEPHISRIDAKIISDIKDSRFLVADVTSQNAGVYFEAGFALGLGRPVIWCVREDDLGKVHFDTRQYNHIAWKTPEELQEQLYQSICANIGRRSTNTSMDER